jgi:NAD(P)H-hydrate epimerase
VTVTFAALKTGLLQGDGALLAGRVEVADIGLDVSRARTWVVQDSDVRHALSPRPRDAHKWQTAVAVVAGSPGLTGAAGLCGRAAYRAGAGMVRLGIPGHDIADLPVPEAVGVALPAADWASGALAMATRCRALVVGPGLGRLASTVADVRSVVARAPIPVVVDADGLFALGTGPEVGAAVRGEPGSPRPPRGVILTPHDGEFARLAGHPPGVDRIEDTRRLAAASAAVVLLKGPVTVVAHPGGGVLLATSGSPRLATAGTGDVLSGAAGAFVARGLDVWHAGALAAHVHGRAAELGPPEGLVAGDVADLLAQWLSGIRRA